MTRPVIVHESAGTVTVQVARSPLVITRYVSIPASVIGLTVTTADPSLAMARGAPGVVGAAIVVDVEVGIVVTTGADDVEGVDDVDVEDDVEVDVDVDVDVVVGGGGATGDVCTGVEVTVRAPDATVTVTA